METNMGTITALKRLVGADRETPRDHDREVAEARKRLEASDAEHVEATATARAIDDEIAELERGLLGTDSEAADRIPTARQERERAGVFVTRAQSRLEVARTALREAEKDRDEQVLAELDRRADANQRVKALWNERGKEAVATFLAFSAELDALLKDVHTATYEAGRMRNDERAQFKIQALGSHRAVVRMWIKDNFSQPARSAAEELFK
jgi:hypothetical protein